MKHMQQGHPVVMEHNPQMRYNRRHAPQPGYWGARNHLGGYGDIGGKDAKKFWRGDNPFLWLSGTGMVLTGVLVYYVFFADR